MSESLKLYVTSHQTGELLGTRDAVKDIKQPERWVIPPYQTPTNLPNENLSEQEYWAYLDSNNKPVRDYQLGAWMKKNRYIKVTAYLKSDATKQKDFDDASLVTDEYTLEKPLTQWDEWVDGSWITNLSNKYIHDYAQVDATRSALYTQLTDPLESELTRKQRQGKTDEVQVLSDRINELEAKIKAENPYPEAPTN